MHAIAFFHIALLLCDRWVRQESHWMQPSEQLIRLKLLDPLHQCKLRAHGSLSWWIILPYQLFQCLIVWYFFAWCLLDSIYCISWYTSTSLMNWAAPYFCQHSHKCTKNVRPVVGVSLAGTTLDAAFRATHPAQATCDHIDISTYLCIYISIYLYIVIWHWRGMHGSCAQGTKNTCRAKKSLRHTANVYMYIYLCMH